MAWKLRGQEGLERRYRVPDISWLKPRRTLRRTMLVYIEAIPRLEMRISVSFGGFPLFWLASTNFLPFSIPRATRVTQSSSFFSLSPPLLLLSRAWIREQERRHCIRRRFPSRVGLFVVGVTICEFEKDGLVLK